jgi:hypothetical protein
MHLFLGCKKGARKVHKGAFAPFLGAFLGAFLIFALKWLIYYYYRASILFIFYHF